MASGAYNNLPCFLNANKLTEVIFPDERNTYRSATKLGDLPAQLMSCYALCGDSRLFAGFSIG